MTVTPALLQEYKCIYSNAVGQKSRGLPPWHQGTVSYVTWLSATVRQPHPYLRFYKSMGYMTQSGNSNIVGWSRNMTLSFDAYFLSCIHDHVDFTKINVFCDVMLCSMVDCYLHLQGRTVSQASDKSGTHTGTVRQWANQQKESKVKRCYFIPCPSHWVENGPFQSQYSSHYSPYSYWHAQRMCSGPPSPHICTTLSMLGLFYLELSWY